MFAGDVVPAKKPDPAIYLLAVDRLGLDPAATLVVEDSRNGLLAATGAGLPCLVTVNGYTREEAFDEAVLVVSELGDPDRPPIEVLADPRAGTPRSTTSRSTTCGRAPAPGRHGPRKVRRGAGHRTRRRCRVSGSAQQQVELVVRTIAETAVDNEKYFGDLDAVVGDGDFGYSLARGFEKVLEDWDGIDRGDVGTFLKKDRDDRHLPDRRDLRARSGAPPSCGPGIDRRRDRHARRRAGGGDAARRRPRASSCAASPTSATRRCSTR